MQPHVVVGHAAVSELAVAAGQPRDRSLDHRPVLPVNGLEPRSVGLSACATQQRVVLVQPHGLALCDGRARSPQRAVAAGRPEDHIPELVDRPGHPGPAGHGAGRLVDGEVVEGVAAGHRRPQRQRLDSAWWPASAAAVRVGHRSHHNSRLMVTVDENAGGADKPIPTIIISDYAPSGPIRERINL